MRTISEKDIKILLMPRPKDSHKGTFGTVNAVVGCSKFRGAAALSTMGALRSGVGIVRVCSTEKVIGAVTVQYPSATLLPLPETDGGYISAKAIPTLLKTVKDTDILLIGCGLGQCTDTAAVVNQLIFGTKARKVIDADALNLLASSGTLEEAEKSGALSGCIVTPHVGEMSRLTKKSIGEISANVDTMIAAAAEFTHKYKCITVLKSHVTVIAAPSDTGVPAPDFDALTQLELKGKSITECTTFEEIRHAAKQGTTREIKHNYPDDCRIHLSRMSNSGLAKGGSGDVLAGLIAGLFAQGYNAEQSAILGVLVHSTAAKNCAHDLSEQAMLPSDLETYICKIFADKYETEKE